jgi:hypothetical protein
MKRKIILIARTDRIAAKWWSYYLDIPKKEIELAYYMNQLKGKWARGCHTIHNKFEIAEWVKQYRDDIEFEGHEN